MLDRNDAPRSPTLQRATTLIRETPPVRDAWRAALDARLSASASRQNETMLSRSSLRPFAAIAAGAVLAAAGISGSLVVRRHADFQDVGVARTRFALVAPRATQVSVVGDFNQWNPAALPLRRSADGRTWVIDVSLRSGRHVYAFVVDGKIAPDPTAAEGEDDGLGMPNSVVVVRGT